MLLKFRYFQNLKTINQILYPHFSSTLVWTTGISIQKRHFLSNSTPHKEFSVLINKHCPLASNYQSDHFNCSCSFSVYTMGRSKNRSKGKPNAGLSGSAAHSKAHDASSSESKASKPQRSAEGDSSNDQKPLGSRDQHKLDSGKSKKDKKNSQAAVSGGLNQSNPGTKDSASGVVSSDLPRSQSETGAVPKPTHPDADVPESPSKSSSPDEPPLAKTISERSTRDVKKVTSFEEDWKVISAIPLEEKRKIYNCRLFCTLEDIPTWADYVKTENYSITKSIRKCVNLPKLRDEYPVDMELNSKVSLFTGDITALEIDCIVNAANSSLLGGGGVDGAIHRAAGGSLLKQCRTLGGCRTGEAKITYGYILPAKHVIHTVGPMTANENDLLSCYQNSLNIALQNNLRSIAFPCIATGVYGFPNDVAAQVVIPLVRKVLSTNDNRRNLDRIIFCLFLQKDIELYQNYMMQVFPVE